MLELYCAAAALWGPRWLNETDYRNKLSFGLPLCVWWSGCILFILTNLRLATSVGGLCAKVNVEVPYGSLCPINVSHSWQLLVKRFLCCLFFLKRQLVAILNLHLSNKHCPLYPKAMNVFNLS